jgi:two-component system, OmpR family, phosphate regulon response regulator PhoB
MRLALLVLEDEPEVRSALLRDLAPLDPPIRIEPAEDADDARAVLRELAADRDVLGLVLADHRLPGTSGVDLLVELHDDPEHRTCRKVLVTGQADQQDTIRAVNEAGLDHYVTKPWDAEELLTLVRGELTSFVLAEGIDPLPHLRALDAARVMPALRDRGDR